VTAFALDPKLEADTLEITTLRLCAARLMNDRRFPWVILVPARGQVSEIIDLDAADRALLMDEIALVSTVMRDLFQPTKLNVGALGNVVTQLHVHVVARYASDAAWPGPVWGTPPELYRPDDIERPLAPLRYRLAGVSR
jgi:diadenosine tetraphosphate (Ap4A) HIT family hydrolase